MESFLQNRPSLATAQHYQCAPTEPGFQPFLRPTSAEQGALSLPAKTADPQRGYEATEPKIELLDRDGTVERIVITCVCCQRIELQCEY